MLFFGYIAGDTLSRTTSKRDNIYIIKMKAKKIIDFHPKFFEAMKNYSREKFSADVMAGIIVGIVAIPLAIAFGIASGVGPT